MLDHEILKNARNGLRKRAFNAMTEEAQMAAAQTGAAPPPPGAAPPMDPAMAGGAPPMDPAMMGGAPPMDPAMMGGAPPMDPAMAGMDPAMMGGMDPAMMGGAPPAEDPMAAGTPVTLNLEDLQQVIKELSGGDEPAEAEGATTDQVMSELTVVKDQLAALAAGMGVQLPAGDVGLAGDTSTAPATAGPEAIDDAAAAMATDELQGNPAFDALEAGVPPEEGMPKVAGQVDWTATKLAQ